MVDPIADLHIGRAFELVLVKLLQAIEHEAAAVRADALGIAEIKHGILCRAELHTAVFRGQEAAAPQVRAERLSALSLGDHHHERRQIGIVLPEAVAEPRAKAGPAGDL